MKINEVELILGNIKELKEMLVKKATEKVKLENHNTIDIARKYHREKKRGLTKLLQEEMLLLETIRKAEMLVGSGK